MGVTPGSSGRPVRLRGVKTRAALATAALALFLVGPADAKVESVLGGLSCTTQASSGDVRQCSGIVHSFDGAPVDVNVTLPPEPAAGKDGNYPLIGMFHGWGGSKLGIGSTAPWAQR